MESDSRCCRDASGHPPPAFPFFLPFFFLFSQVPNWQEETWGTFQILFSLYPDLHLFL